MMPFAELLRSAAYRGGPALFFPFRRDGFLRSSGWVRSVLKLSPQSPTGQPMPWLTQPAVSFLQPLLTPSMKVGEYGSGNSTLWLASKVGSVVSVEHSAEWVRKFKVTAPENVELRVPEGSGKVDLPADAFRRPKAFPQYAASLDDVADLDLVLVDGLDRVGCVMSAIALSVGIIVVDNTDERYKQDFEAAMRALSAAEYRRFDFHGVALGSWHLSCTTVFLAPTNRFGL